MRKHAIYGFATFLAATTYAQTIHVRGKVMDAANQPVANAKVELLVAKRSTTTGNDGAYALNSGVNVLRPFPDRSSGGMRLDKGVLELAVPEAAPVRVEIFDVQGNLLDRTVLAMASAGTYRLNLAGRVRSDKLLIAKASVGDRTMAFPFLSKSGVAGKKDAAWEHASPAVAVLAKVSAIIDTLRITAQGFASRQVPLSSYDTTVNMALESASGDLWGGLKNPPMRSSGCGRPALQSGTFRIASGGLNREYILSVPANYDADKPSRMVYGMHWMNGSMQAVQSDRFFQFQPRDTEKNIIFVAPQGYTDGMPWRTGANDSTDHVFFNDLHKYLLGNLCVDSSRVFMTGFSFGGMITYSLSTNHQHQIRASVGVAPANFNIHVPRNKPDRPIAWMQTTGMGDETTPWINNRPGGNPATQGAKWIAMEHAKRNGCTLPSDIPTWQQGGKVCYDFQGCKAGYPVKACTFDGGHVKNNTDRGSNVDWIPEESWKFFMQF